MCIGIKGGVSLCLITIFGVIYSTTGVNIQQYPSVDRAKRQSSTTSGGGCGSLKQVISEEEFCYKDDLQVPCPISAEIGAVIVKKCRPFYNKDGITNTSYICESNGWTSIDRPCQAECGLKSTGATPLIIGGEVAEEGEYPWAVIIYYKGKIICSGTIISPYHVVTGATCVASSSGPVSIYEYIIVAGKYYLDLNKTEEFQQIPKIKRIIPHDDYQADLLKYRDNIALVEFAEPFQFNSYVRPACIDWNNTYEAGDFVEDNEAEVIGWGPPAESGPNSEVLRKLSVAYKTQKTCLRVFPEDFKQKYFLNDKLCAGHINKGKAVCFDDLGSGLFFKSDQKRYFVRGLLFFSPGKPGACDSDQLSLYTKVSRYLPWLRTQLESNENLAFQFGSNKRGGNGGRQGCVLPEHIRYGRFSMNNGGNYIEKRIVPVSTLIFLSCIDDTNRVSRTYFHCLDNDWLPSVEQTKCKKPGTCPTLKKSKSEEIFCKIDDNRVGCEEPVNGTTAIARCEPLYTFEGNRPIYKCENGKWDPPFSSCVPECGTKRVSTQTLIIGGGETVQNEFPWVVAIYNANNEQICAGSIISRFYVVSAAHCFTSDRGKPKAASEFLIVAGKHFRDLNADEPSAQRRTIKSLFVHEDYKGKIQKHRDDIALIELSEELSMTFEVEPVCMDWNTIYEDFDFIDGNNGVIVGWGNTQEGGLPSTVLKKLVVPYRSKRVCAQHLPQDYAQEFLASDKICAGYRDGGGNACNGDSGGGLYFKSDNGKFYIRGITSIGVRSKIGCDQNYYTLYTKVSKYLSWIEEKTRRVV